MSSNDDPQRSTEAPTTHRAPEHTASHQSSTSSKASQQQPPFPISGTAPDKRNPPPHHPNAEHLINIAAKHVVPDVPAPSADDEEDKAQIGMPGKDEKEKREQEPLLRGTPLDELLTPGLGLSQDPRRDDQDSKDGRSETSAPEQRARASTYTAPTRQVGRPGFGAVRGVGSDSVSSVLLYNQASSSSHRVLHWVAFRPGRISIAVLHAMPFGLRVPRPPLS